MKVFSLILLLFLFSCEKEELGNLQLGNWGTEHASLAVQEDSWYIEFDCAHATVQESVEFTNGKFEAVAEYFREAGVQLDDPEYYKAIPAKVSGELLGNGVLDLTMLVGPDLENYGTYTFNYDKEAMVYKCA